VALEDVARFVSTVRPGHKIKVNFSNQDFAIDLAAWCQEQGHRVVETGSKSCDSSTTACASSGPILRISYTVLAICRQILSFKFVAQLNG
jgi:TusA-related sulfurtransferase